MDYVYFHFEVAADNDDMGFGFNIFPVSKEDYDTYMRNYDDLEHFHTDIRNLVEEKNKSFLNSTVWDF